MRGPPFVLIFSQCSFLSESKYLSSFSQPALRRKQSISAPNPPTIECRSSPKTESGMLGPTVGTAANWTKHAEALRAARTAHHGYLRPVLAKVDRAVEGASVRVDRPQHVSQRPARDSHATFIPRLLMRHFVGKHDCVEHPSRSSRSPARAHCSTGHLRQPRRRCGWPFRPRCG
jgi:hypothetical protein